MTWISKTLQINPGSYGVLKIHVDSVMERAFRLTTYSYTDCGGNHDHNNFSFPSVDKIIEAAKFLYDFSIARVIKERKTLYVQQEHKIRGELCLSVELNGRLELLIDGGKLVLTKKQAKKLSGYLFFSAGEILIGTRKIVVPKEIKNIFDINDNDEG